MERQNFGPFGNRRNINWTDAVTSIISQITTQGYTGHEMDDELGLINMNARQYDPKLGRFLQADSIVPNPTSTQSFNRYSYVGNNPMSFVDPDGYAPDESPEQPDNDYEEEEEERDELELIEIEDGGFSETFEHDGYYFEADFYADHGEIRAYRIDNDGISEAQSDLTNDWRDDVYDMEERLDELREDAAEFREYLYGNAPPAKNPEPQNVESFDYSKMGRDVASKLLTSIKAMGQWFKETMGIMGNTSTIRGVGGKISGSVASAGVSVLNVNLAGITAKFMIERNLHECAKCNYIEDYPKVMGFLNENPANYEAIVRFFRRRGHELRVFREK